MKREDKKLIELFEQEHELRQAYEKEQFLKFEKQLWGSIDAASDWRNIERLLSCKDCTDLMRVKTLMECEYNTKITITL